MRVAEQRSKRGRGPRGLSEGEHKRNLLRDKTRARVPQRPAIVSSAGNPDRLIVGATNLGSPSLAYLSWRSKKGKLPPGNPRLPSSAKRYTAAFCEYQLGFRLRGDDGISNPSTRAPPSPQCRHHPHQCLSFNSTAAKFAKPIYRFHHARQPHWPNFPTASSRPTPANPACNKTRQPKRADCRR